MNRYHNLDTQSDENTSQSMRNRIANTLSSSLNTFRHAAENARGKINLALHTPNNTNPDYIDFKYYVNMLDDILNKYNNNKHKNKANEEKIKEELEPILKKAFGHAHTAILVLLKNNAAKNKTIAGEIADKFFEELLETKGTFLDVKGNIIYTTPSSHYTSSGGSYKKRRRRSLKKSRRVKRRKTNATRKSRK